MNSIAGSTSWKDAGVAPGAYHMYADAETLDLLQVNAVDRVVVRVFQWDKPTVSFGYLLDEDKVKQWADALNVGHLDHVKRPTGGGAVLHTASDLSFSVAWRREMSFFSDSPRACYEQIHRRVLDALIPSHPELALLVNSSGNCEAPPPGLPQEGGEIGVPVCFREPVCNDVMAGEQKVIGGALRITKNAILYQGTIQFPSATVPELKDAVRRAFL